jgi:hypothetical protein
MFDGLTWPISWPWGGARLADGRTDRARGPSQIDMTASDEKEVPAHDFENGSGVGERQSGLCGISDPGSVVIGGRDAGGRAGCVRGWSGCERQGAPGDWFARRWQSVADFCSPLPRAHALPPASHPPSPPCRPSPPRRIRPRPRTAPAAAPHPPPARAAPHLRTGTHIGAAPTPVAATGFPLPPPRPRCCVRAAPPRSRPFCATDVAPAAPAPAASPPRRGAMVDEPLLNGNGFHMLLAST